MPNALEQSLARPIALRETGRFEESRRLLENLVARKIRLHGRKAYDTQCAMSQLGRTLRLMGRVAEAAELHWEVLAIRLEVYGRRDVFTENSAGILADTLRDFQHDHYLAAAVESWPAEPESSGQITRAGPVLTAGELQQFIRDRVSTAARDIAKLVDEYLQQLAAPASRR